MIEPAENHPALLNDQPQHTETMQTKHTETGEQTHEQPIRLSRDELIAAAQQDALNSNANPVVRVRADGAAEIVGEDDPEMQGCFRIPVERFVSDHNTDIDAMRDLWRDEPDKLEEARGIWTVAIELHDEIPEFLSPVDETLTVEYQEAR